MCWQALSILRLLRSALATSPHSWVACCLYCIGQRLLSGKYGGHSHHFIPLPLPTLPPFSTQVTVRVFECEGKSQRESDCIQLGQLRLKNLSPQPRGVPQVRVTLMLNDNDTRLGVMALVSADKKLVHHPEIFTMMEVRPLPVVLGFVSQAADGEQHLIAESKVDDQ